MPKKKTTDVSFEVALTKLEEIVRKMEKGDLPLEDTIKAYEEGLNWSKLAQEKLEEAKGKVEIATYTKTGEVTRTPFKSEEQ